MNAKRQPHPAIQLILQRAWLTQYQNGQWITVRPFNVFLPVVLRNAGP